MRILFISILLSEFVYSWLIHSFIRVRHCLFISPATCLNELACLLGAQKGVPALLNINQQLVSVCAIYDFDLKLLCFLIILHPALALSDGNKKQTVCHHHGWLLTCSVSRSVQTAVIRHTYRVPCGLYGISPLQPDRTNTVRSAMTAPTPSPMDRRPCAKSQTFYCPAVGRSVGEGAQLRLTEFCDVGWRREGRKEGKPWKKGNMSAPVRAN